MGPITTVAARLLHLLLLLFALPVAARAQFNYTTSNGQITITRYTGASSAVDIPRTIDGLPVTTIWDQAFFGSHLTSVTIPDSVTHIGSRAFSGCTGLTNITIPNGVTNIGNDAFYCCTGLTNFTIPNGVPTIGTQSFFF